MGTIIVQPSSRQIETLDAGSYSAPVLLDNDNWASPTLATSNGSSEVCLTQ
jgi:hypothetical protein